MAKKDRRQIAEINVVPYIDVMLVLLVIFMITTPIITQGVNVDLPDATSQPMDTNQEAPVVITVTADGGYSLRDTGEDQHFDNVDDVVKRVKLWRSRNPNAPVVIGGDQKTAYGNVVVLMARLQGVGVQNVGLLTKDPGELTPAKSRKK